MQRVGGGGDMRRMTARCSPLWGAGEMGGVDTETRPWRTSTGRARWARSTLRRWRSFSVLPASVATPNTFPCYRCCFPLGRMATGSLCATSVCCAGCRPNRRHGRQAALAVSETRRRRRLCRSRIPDTDSRIRTRGYGLASDAGTLRAGACSLGVCDAVECGVSFAWAGARVAQRPRLLRAGALLRRLCAGWDGAHTVPRGSLCAGTRRVRAAPG